VIEVIEKSENLSIASDTEATTLTIGVSCTDLRLDTETFPEVGLQSPHKKGRRFEHYRRLRVGSFALREEETTIAVKIAAKEVGHEVLWYDLVCRKLKGSRFARGTLQGNQLLYNSLVRKRTTDCTARSSAAGAVAFYRHTRAQKVSERGDDVLVAWVKENLGAMLWGGSHAPVGIEKTECVCLLLGVYTVEELFVVYVTTGADVKSASVNSLKYGTGIYTSLSADGGDRPSGGQVLVFDGFDGLVRRFTDRHGTCSYPQNEQS
jgi:hypothetical protein